MKLEEGREVGSGSGRSYVEVNIKSTLYVL